MTSYDDDPVARMRRAAPAGVDELDRRALQEAAAELREEILAHATGRAETVSLPGRRRPPLRTMLTAAVLVAALAGTAGAAYLLTARTGRRVEGRTTEQTVGSEIIRLDAQDLPAVVAELAADYPLPPSMTSRDIAARIATDEPTEMDEVGVESAVAFVAYCGWQRQWLDTRVSGDAVKERVARDALIRAAGWPIFAKVDGGGLVQGLRENAAAVRVGDEGPIRRDVRINC